MKIVKIGITTLLMSIVVTLPGCAKPYYKPRKVGADFQMIARDAGVSLGVIHIDGNKMKLCMEGAPDTAFDQDSSMSISANLVSVGGGGEGAGEGSEEVELVGRTPALLFAREVFYRTCEAALSSNASPEEWREMFAVALQVSTDVMKLESQVTKVEIIEKEESNNKSSADFSATQSSSQSSAQEIYTEEQF